MKAKKLNWQQQDNIIIAKFMGITLSVIPNNGKWDARLYNNFERPETQSGFDSINEAKQYAERVMLYRELTKYFTTPNESK